MGIVAGRQGMVKVLGGGREGASEGTVVAREIWGDCE